MEVASAGSTAIYWCGLCECSCSDNIDCVISHVCDQQHRTNYMVTSLYYIRLLLNYVSVYMSYIAHRVAQKLTDQTG